MNWIWETLRMIVVCNKPGITPRDRNFNVLKYALLVLNADESSLIAMQLDMNPIVDSRQSLDLFPR